jgi:hypothetical protein
MDACRERFSEDPKVTYHLNQSDSLASIEDGSIDFIFSFDSLVHVRPQSIEAYLSQFAAKMKPEALGFIHYSTLGQFASSLAGRSRALMRKPPASDHQRDPGMTADLFLGLCEQSGLKCISQELVNWRGRRLIDCFSMIARSQSTWPAATEPLRNRDFMLEAKLMRRVAAHYPQPA